MRYSLTGRLRPLSCDESSPIDDIVYAFKLLFKQRDSKSTHIVHSKLRSIFGSDTVSEAFIYFCLHGAATSLILRNELDMPEATSYRALKRLRTLGFIVPAMKVSKVKHSLGGPRPTVWALEGASPEEVTRAYHMMRESRREADK